MKSKRTTEIPETKVNQVKELNDLIKKKKTILVASIKNIPASQFQEIGKKLRGKAIIKVPKKNLIFRTLDSADGDEIKKIKEQIKDSVAILFSDMDCFDLAAELVANKSPAKAKTGQEAPDDIEIPAGPTELVPGPAISELGALGIQIQIDKGKINIKEPKVIVKKGEKISENAAGIMSKLDIKPFSIGFIPLSAFDTQESKLYLDIKIDKEKTISDLKEAFGRALPFAVSVGYVSEDTIGFMIQKAGAYANKINRIMTGEPEPVAEVVEEKKEVQETKPKEEEMHGTESHTSSKQSDDSSTKAPAAAGLGALFG